VFVVGVNGPVKSARVAVGQPATCAGVNTIEGRSAAAYVFSGAGFSAGIGVLWTRAALALVTWAAVPHAFSRQVAAIPKTKAARRTATDVLVTGTVLR
jgi:hypothetical protein